MGAVGEAKTTGGRRVQGSFVKLREVAKKVGVHHSTILRWVEQKKVPVSLLASRPGRGLSGEANEGIGEELD